MPTVALHFWAGARAAAGTEWDRYEAVSLADALAQAATEVGREGFEAVLARCSFLVDGVAVRVHDLDAPLSADVTVEVLPPFAGGGDRSSSRITDSDLTEQDERWRRAMRVRNLAT